MAKNLNWLILGGGHAYIGDRSAATWLIPVGVVFWLLLVASMGLFALIEWPFILMAASDLQRKYTTLYGEAPVLRSGHPDAGWYADPQGAAARRYWDGNGWTENLRST